MATKNGSIRLSDLLGDVRQADVKWMGHEFWVKYKPSAITPAMYRQTKVVAMPGDRWGSEAIKVAVTAILVEWSIKDDHDLMVPITTEVMDGLPNDMLHEIYDACWLDSHPLPKNENESNPSSNTDPAPA